jgi:heavy metal sensor kinase
VTRSWPLRARLALWFSAVLGLVLAALAATTWWALRASFDAAVDAGLAERVQAVARFLGEQNDPASLAEMQEDLREYAVLDPGWGLLRIVDPDGVELYRSAAFDRGGLPALSPGVSADYRNVLANERPLRMLSAHALVRQRPYTVQVAVPTGELREAFERFRAALIGLLPLGVLAAGAGGYWISGRALAPVGRIEAAAREITARQLDRRLEVPATADELSRLSATLNSMLDRLEAAFREATRFTADASHELRTPVSLIRTSAEVALRRERPAAEYRQALETVLLEAERMSALVQDLLTLARADAGVEGLRRGSVDLGTLASGLEGSLRAMCDTRGLELRVEAPREPVVVAGDHGALEQLVLSLADNAVKYTPAPGGVSVSVSRSVGEAVVTVADTGIGIAPEDLPQVFDRFYRADKARSRDSGGTGLGLSIVKSIAEQHGGTIGIVSRPGEGTRVEVRFPAEATAAGATARS